LVSEASALASVADADRPFAARWNPSKIVRLADRPAEYESCRSAETNVPVAAL
jgi:hypothetical protein